MYSNEISLRVRYAETDQMGYVYYGNYAQYYEVGRVELLRSIGVSYKSLEEMGYELPVVNFSINYLKPAHYDDNLILKTSLIEIPTPLFSSSLSEFRSLITFINNIKGTFLFFLLMNGLLP